jgi:mannose-1-phosphate guanylyltransferase
LIIDSIFDIFNIKKGASSMVKPVIVIMAGGRGERFWPRSRHNYPKQLLNIIGNQSLLQESVERVHELTEYERIYIVISHNYIQEVRNQLPMIPARNILIEPEGRNTAPCVGLAAVYIESHFPKEDPVIAILPSDSHIKNPAEMRRVLEAGIAYAATVTLGVIYGMWPTRPETGFGYIQLGKELGKSQGIPYHRVAAFKEKPDFGAAQRYFEQKEYLWNGGIFLWKRSGLQKEIKKNLPQLAKGLDEFKQQIGTPGEAQKLKEIYPTLPATSVDYGILEKTEDLVVIPTDYGWDDLGSWSALERTLPRDEAGNVIQGNHIGVDTSNCVIYSPQKPVTTLGVSDLIIVEMDDVLFVGAKERAQDVKLLLAKLREENRKELL